MPQRGATLRTLAGPGGGGASLGFPAVGVSLPAPSCSSTRLSDLTQPGEEPRVHMPAEGHAPGRGLGVTPVLLWCSSTIPTEETGSLVGHFLGWETEDAGSPSDFAGD